MSGSGGRGGKRVEAAMAEQRRTDRRATKDAKRQARRTAKRQTSQEQESGHAESSR
jgi:hypothetical protein